MTVHAHTTHRPRRMLRRTLAALAALCLTATSCGDSESMYCRYPCRFVFNPATHASSAALLTTVGTPGTFCTVSRVTKCGASYYHFVTTDGISDDVIFTMEDQRSTVLIGLNNAIVFGYGNVDYPPVLYAYDMECPNCFDPEAIPVRSHQIRTAQTGMATCPTCHRQYNLNTGGNVVGGDPGKQLSRYRAHYAPGGVLSVIN